VAQAGASDEWVEIFCKLVKEWKPREWAEEQGQIRAGVGPFLERMQRERQAFVYRRDFPTCVATRRCAHNPSVGAWRSKGCTSRRTRRGCPICAAELLSFPAGKHDDQVDALGLIGQLLDTIADGNKPVAPEKSKNPSGYRTHTAITSATAG
jgi:hypothetical protein